MRTCPNRNCRMLHDDEVNQCPECGANMNRTPDRELDMNMELFAMRDRAMRERALEQRLKSRRPGSQEIDTGAPVQVLETANEAAAWILGLYPREVPE